MTDQEFIADMKAYNDDHLPDGYPAVTMDKINRLIELVERPELLAAIEECGRITKSKGFDTSHHLTQVALIATEVGEALECISSSGNYDVDGFANHIVDGSALFETHRKTATDHSDKSAVANLDNLMEELADICIRVFSYAAGNGNGERLAEAIRSKMEKNSQRPERHGKAF